MTPRWNYRAAVRVALAGQAVDGQVLVDLVADDQEVVVAGEPGDVLELGAAHDLARRDVGRVEEDRPRLGRGYGPDAPAPRPAVGRRAYSRTVTWLWFDTMRPPWTPVCTARPRSRTSVWLWL